MADATTEALARDMIYRALAALRERNVVPSVDLPPVTLEPLPDERGYATRIAVELAQAAEAADIPNISAETLTAALAGYLAEVVDLVPAYSDIARVEPGSDGTILLYLRPE